MSKLDVGEYAAIYDHEGACWSSNQDKINYGEMSRTVGLIVDVQGDLIMIRTKQGERKVGSRKCARRVKLKPKPRVWRWEVKCDKNHIICLICQNQKTCCNCQGQYHGCVTWKRPQAKPSRKKGK